jgi:hypothetical protein
LLIPEIVASRIELILPERSNNKIISISRISVSFN